MQGVDPFLRFCLSKGSITLANGARFVIRGIEGQKMYIEQTNKTTASGGGKTDWYNVGQTNGIYAMSSYTPVLLTIDSEHSVLDDLRAEYDAILAQTYVAEPADTTEMAANLATYNSLRTALGLPTVS